MGQWVKLSGGAWLPRRKGGSWAALRQAQHEPHSIPPVSSKTLDKIQKFGGGQIELGLSKWMQPAPSLRA